MKVAVFWDSAINIDSYYVKDNTAYSYWTDKPFTFHHSISSKCFPYIHNYQWFGEGSSFLALNDWVDRKTIISESGIKSTIVDNALRALKGRNIIMQNTQRRGEYKLPTKSFSVWIKTKRIAEESADNAAPGLFEAGEDDNSGL